MPDTDFSQDRLVRKEDGLGFIRELPEPEDHIGLSLIAPFQEVASDDVVFGYTRGAVAGLAPARAEDAESEMATQDDSTGSGRASIMDWALKDHYDASDVTRYREGLLIGDLVGAQSLQLTSTNMTEEWARKVARHDALRKRKLDNRLEWLIMQGLDLGVIAYNDGKIQWSVDFGRPAAQKDMATINGNKWSAANADPIDDIETIRADARDKGFEIDRVIVSDKALRNLYKNDKFVAGVTGTNPLYTIGTGTWGRQDAISYIENQTGVTFIPYDSVFRTRPLGSNTITNNRFTREDTAIFLPSASTMRDVESDVGFAATLTAPHPEGMWASGFYEWEQETKDPWGTDRGTGIKAFPVFPHLDLTYTMEVL